MSLSGRAEFIGLIFWRYFFAMSGIKTTHFSDGCIILTVLIPEHPKNKGLSQTAP